MLYANAGCKQAPEEHMGTRQPPVLQRLACSLRCRENRAAAKLRGPLGPGSFDMLMRM